MNSPYTEVISNQSNTAELNKIYVRLLGERMRMDKFFSMYLDRFEKKMDPEKTKTQIWDLYKKKMKEYAELNRAVKAAEYFIKKPRYHV